MREKVNHVVIGGFVMGALLLAVAGILVFGSGRFMKQTENYVLYFEGGLKGLGAGSTVAYRGVKIGSVTEVAIKMNAVDLSTQIPVIIEVENDRFEIVGGDFEDDPRKSIQKLIDIGLRAKLVTESFLTGKLMIELGFYPDTPVRILGLDPSYQEIPTIPSTIEEIRNTLMNLPIEELFTKTIATVEAINQVASSPEIPQGITSIRMAAEDFRKLSNDVNAQVELLTTSTREAMGDYRQLALSLDEGIVSLLTGLNDALENASRSFQQMESSLGTLENMVSEDSVMNNELNNMLTEFAAAARSIRELAEYIERHPEALIRGKREDGR